LCRLAVLWALAIDHPIPPGDTGVIAFVSTTRDEASQRLRTIRALLDALDVPYRPAGETIELADHPLAFKVFACNVASVSGFTSVLVIADEVAKWLNADSGANPAREVLAALRPTMATQPHARIVLSSSPLATLDAHHEAFAAGDTTFQRVAYAPTWVANPTITEADTRRLEPDERVWAREYAATPSDAVSAALDGATVDAAVTRPPRAQLLGAPVLIIDASSGRGDTFAWCLAAWVRPDLPPEAFERADLPGYHPPSDRELASFRELGMNPPADPRPVKRNEWWDPIVRPEWQSRIQSRLVLWAVDGVEGPFADRLRLDELVVGLMRRLFVTQGDAPRRAIGDQREAYALEAEFRRHGVSFTSIPWTAPSKADAVQRLRRLLADGRLTIDASSPKADDMRRQLKGFSERILPSGTITFGARAGHDDFAALALTACMADLEGALRGSPIEADKTVATRSMDSRLAKVGG
jgi:hypothetical protein